jgi:hypothetical protein
MNTFLIPRYTDAVLAFEFSGDRPPTTLTAPSKDDVAQFVQRTLKMFRKSGAEHLVLMGLGTGAYALGLAETLEDAERLIVCETDTDLARTFLEANPAWRDESGPASVIGDISLWAHLSLLLASGVTTENTHTALSPELAEDDRRRYQSLQRLFTQARPHQAINSSYLSHVAVQAPDLSVAAILKPDEPGLDGFFKQIPDWVKEVVVVWDAEEVPSRELACAAPIKHFAHPLEDFASQRNRMLEECEGDWVLYLDGDECFSEDVWSLFTALMLIKRLEACYFPRMTFYPDEQSCKVGFGLWPDLQLRLFRNRESVRFVRPVHERLTGIEGRVALALDAPIHHFSRLRKSPEELAAKLKRFDEAGGDRIRHLLNDAYPSLARTNFPEAAFIAGSLQVVLLEENPA